MLLAEEILLITVLFPIASVPHTEKKKLRSEILVQLDLISMSWSLCMLI